MTTRIEFRELRRANNAIYWQVEAYSEEGSMFPVAEAFVVELEGRQFAQLNYIIVFDQWRRRGIGTAIVEACRVKWPLLEFTSPMDDEQSIAFAHTIRSPHVFDTDED